MRLPGKSLLLVLSTCCYAAPLNNNTNSPTSEPPIYAYSAWSHLVKNGVCSKSSSPLDIKIPPKSPGGNDAVVTCTLLEHGMKDYVFPPGIFEIDEQLLIPDNTSITGANNPNDVQPTETPDWNIQTLFLATRGAVAYAMQYCHARDMVTTRVGFVLSSHVSVRNIAYQGIDTIRPDDNGALCGGGAFETKGCAENDCKKSSVNNGGSDGVGSHHVKIENVRLNDYYHREDAAKIGAHVHGNTNCSHGTQGCCFCKPNGVRASQVVIWVPETRNSEGTQHLRVNNVVSKSSQADGINLHGYVRDAWIQNTLIENTGDDTYAVWGAALSPENITFSNNVAVNPGILRPRWYGNCVATYGLKNVVFQNLTCRAPTLRHPLPNYHPDTSMFIFYTSFGGIYPPGNRVTIEGFTFEDLEGEAYTPQNGVIWHGNLVPRKMAWTKTDEDKGGVVAPYYSPSTKQQVNVYVTDRT